MENCKHYDEENGWCKLHSDWSEAMPVIAFCSLGPCGDYEERRPTYDELYEHWLKTAYKKKKKRETEILHGQISLFDTEELFKENNND